MRLDDSHFQERLEHIYNQAGGVLQAKPRQSQLKDFEVDAHGD